MLNPTDHTRLSASVTTRFRYGALTTSRQTPYFSRHQSKFCDNALTFTHSFFIHPRHETRSRESLTGTAQRLGYRLEHPRQRGSIPARKIEEILFFCQASSPSLGYTQPPIEYIPTTLPSRKAARASK
jgi:hypothetical protein